MSVTLPRQHVDERDYEHMCAIHLDERLHADHKSFFSSGNADLALPSS